MRKGPRRPGLADPSLVQDAHVALSDDDTCL
jgi:hypothetical protein